MHDPMTVAFEIRYPWRKYARSAAQTDFERHYRESFITIWHVDPDLRDDDDSCGWFMRARHGNQAVLDKIVSRFEFDWDRSYTSERTGELHCVGYFHPDTGLPLMSPVAITTNLFFLAALETLGSRERAVKFLNANLFEIVHFAENPTDSLYDNIILKYGYDVRRDERIRSFASILYSWILREVRPWWQHPRWHVWHWRLQIHPYQQLRRFLLTRCCKCGRRFHYGESPVSNQWNSPKTKFLRGEVGLYHSECHAHAQRPAATTESARDAGVRP